LDALPELFDDGQDSPAPILSDYHTWDGKTYAVRPGVKPKKGLTVTRGKGLAKVESVRNGIAYLSSGHEVPTEHLTVVYATPIKEMPVKTVEPDLAVSDGEPIANDGATPSAVDTVTETEVVAAADDAMTTEVVTASVATSLAEIIPMPPSTAKSAPTTATKSAPARKGKEKALTKSKERIQKHGEVFTPQWMVEYMLDLEDIKAASYSLTKTFMEPSAGDGNFLVEILDRKLTSVVKDYSRTLSEYENYALFALSSIYGVELLTDNCDDCRENLLNLFIRRYKQIAAIFGGEIRECVIEAARTIISVNIINGNFLTNKQVDGKDIVIYWWDMAHEVGEDEYHFSYTRQLLSTIGNVSDELFAPKPVTVERVAPVTELNGACLVA